MKIAYLCEPQFGGTYTFFRRLRPRLAERGVDFVCIPPYSVETFDGSPFEGAEGVEFLELPSELPAATEVLIRHVTDRAYDAVLILPGCDVLTTNLARYLPRELRCAARVALMSRGAYAPTRVVAEHLDGLFAVSHRVTHDLVQSWSISPERIRTIYNGAVLRSRPERVSADGRRPIRLIYTGRFSDIDKGTLMLPRIVQQAVAAGADVTLTAVGSGPDEERFRAELHRRGVAARVTIRNNLPLKEVDALLDESDVFLLPSRLEACPNAMLQAMEAGCVPVAFHIHESVDRIVEDGVSGLLAPPGDTTAFGRAIARLAGDQGLRERMSAAARQRIEKHFTAERAAELYAEGFRALLEAPDRRPPALPLDQYAVPRALWPTWRTRVPMPVKNLLRKWMERFGLTA